MSATLLFPLTLIAQKQNQLSSIKPLFDYKLRDPSICTGPDGTYYLTGTTANNPAGNTDTTGWWYKNEGIRIWKSKDLKKWEPMGLVWSLDKGATWMGTFFGSDTMASIIETPGILPIKFDSRARFRPLMKTTRISKHK